MKAPGMPPTNAPAKFAPSVVHVGSCSRVALLPGVQDDIEVLQDPEAQHASSVSCQVLSYDPGATRGGALCSMGLTCCPLPGAAGMARTIRLYNTGEMIELSIPGMGSLRLENLVTDVNGTLAVDGILIDGLARRIAAIRDRLSVHLLTADTHGRQAAIDQQLGLVATRLASGNEQEQKRAYVEQLGAHGVVAIGQGANDAAMLKAAALGICVMSREGAALETLLSADIVVPDVVAAFDLLDKPLRLIATLRK
jgi:soluble P-type ATPase